MRPHNKGGKYDNKFSFGRCLWSVSGRSLRSGEEQGVKMTLEQQRHNEELISVLLDFIKGDREIEEVTDVMNEDDEEFYEITRDELRLAANGTDF